MVQRSHAKSAIASIMALLLVCVYLPNLYRSIVSLRVPNEQVLKLSDAVLLVTSTSTVAQANATNATLQTKRKENKKRYKKGADPNRTLPPSDAIHQGPLAKLNTLEDRNKTKIVGFINGGYSGIGRLWYNRLETLGYDNHYIICTDNETCSSFLHDDTSTQQYRTEASFVPAAPIEFATRPYSEKQRRRITMMFAHRWVYLLEQLKLGNHVLLTDVDNIFTSYYNMSELEQSEFDVFHALETKHPTDVFDHQGFVFCGGMAWFRSSPRTIRYIEEMVRRCGMECDDQVLLNQILAYDLGVKWNRTEAEHMELTTHTEDTNVTLSNLGNHWERLVGLVTKGFTGYSEATGLKIKVWDRDFAYRGMADPSVCPVGNWVSMPFVTVGLRAAAIAAKMRSFDAWDEHCPNEYTNRTSSLTRTSPPSYDIYHGPLTHANTSGDLNKTKIVGFINGGYSGIGRLWYNRLETLGYDNHYIICTDNETCNSFLHDDTSTQQYRTEASFIPSPPPRFATRPYSEKQRRRVKMMLEQRWVYLLEQLKLGNHILLTDVDNIFTSFYEMSELEQSEFDVYHALETKHPTDVFDHQGFVFCGGMAWFRSSPRTIRYIEEMVRRCGMECDDQVLLNQILAYDLGVKWNRTEAEHMELTTHTEDTNVTLSNLGNHWERLVGLVTKGFTGYSEATGLKIKVWDRDFAYRGMADPSVCPVRNWVSMPFVTVGLRAAAIAAKKGSFDLWDEHCPNEFTNRTGNLTRTSPPSYDIYHGPLTHANTWDDLNRTKIVGFINGGYSGIGRQWYNRLETLGYDNHYIICTDNETCSSFLHDDTSTQQYRAEASFVPAAPIEFATRPYSEKQRRRVKMMFAHRWVYLLEQLKLGNHILLTDVDNIFTSYYNMSELEQSEFDVFHALETKHPTDVFDHQGFVFCGGMAWFRSSPRTIRYIEEMVRRCGMECDDQVLLNQLLAYDLGVKWNRTGAEHKELTTHTEDTNVTLSNLGNHWERLVGLVMKGFTGYSEATGLKIRVWDRDFAYRGQADPSVCPVRNWVSMPFVTVGLRAAAIAAKKGSFDLWDEHCPNEFTNRTGNLTRTSPPSYDIYHGPLTHANTWDDLNKTKIVGFINGGYSGIGRQWYSRLETLGYDNHYIICTDNETCSSFLHDDTSTQQYRTEASFVPAAPIEFSTRPYSEKQRRRITMMFAHRWVYLLEQLKLGNHILLTDVDNIFTSYYNMSELEQSEFDVFHALETKHPTDVFDHQGFVFCGGMAWFRSSPRTIRYIEEMVRRCGMECDDQVLLNQILAYDLGVKWNRTGAEHKELTTHTEDTNVTLDNLGNHWERLVGLVTKGFTGYSEAIGLKIMVWDRDFAYRGQADPSVCPVRNWVSMPLVSVGLRAAAAAAKLRSFDVWDEHCPNEYTNRTSNLTPTLPPPYDIYNGPLTQPNTWDDLNKTKIVGFINGGYSGIGRIWFNRLETLGYDNHYIICTDNETYSSFLHDNTSNQKYRTEASFIPAAPPRLLTRPHREKQRRRVKMMFAHRWVYLLEQLKLGNHILLTDVDNVFTSFYNMSELEQSEFDVFHALETKHPTDVYLYQGFVVCGGMAWFRSSPRTIRYIEEMVRSCGIECDDQVLLNRILAYDLGVKWNRTGAEHMELTTHTEDTNVTHVYLGNHWERLVGLVTRGFTGYSEAIGLKIKVWDRDFAYRGKADPSVCPVRNWVSMPFVTVAHRAAAAAAKEMSFDVWDEHCPNEYTNRTLGIAKNSSNSISGS